MSDAQWRLISADQRREILTIAANGDVIVHDKEAVAEHIARLRGWLGIIEETGDPHSITCARNALAGDPVPTRTLNEP